MLGDPIVPATAYTRIEKDRCATGDLETEERRHARRRDDVENREDAPFPKSLRQHPHQADLAGGRTTLMFLDRDFSVIEQFARALGNRCRVTDQTRRQLEVQAARFTARRRFFFTLTGVVERKGHRQRIRMRARLHIGCSIRIRKPSIDVGESQFSRRRAEARRNDRTRRTQRATATDFDVIFSFAGSVRCDTHRDFQRCRSFGRPDAFDRADDFFGTCAPFAASGPQALGQPVRHGHRTAAGFSPSVVHIKVQQPRSSWLQMCRAKEAERRPTRRRGRRLRHASRWA